MLFFVLTMYLIAYTDCIKKRDTVLRALTSSRMAIFGIGFITTMLFNFLLFSYLFRNTDFLTVSNSTFAYFFGIVAPLFAFLNWFPEMVGIFENTIGIAIVRWIPSLNYDNIVKAFQLKAEGVPIIPMDFIIPRLSVFGSEEYIDKINKGDNTYKLNFIQYCSSGEEIDNSKYKTFLRDVFQMCLAKHTIGHMAWYLVSVSLVVLLSYGDQRNKLTVE